MSNTTEALAYVVPIWARNTAIAYITMATFIGLPGNFLVIAVQVKNKRKTPTDWFTMFMATSDNMALIICAPPFIMACTGVWPLIGVAFWCKLHFFTLHLTNLVSASLILCVGIDRYNSIVSRHPNIQFTSSNVVKACVGAIIISVVLSVGQIFVVDNNVFGQCMFSPSLGTGQKIIHGITSIFVVGGSGVLTILYVKIIRCITLSMKVSAGATNRLSAMSSSSRSRILKTTKLMTIVTFVFILFTCVTSIAAVFLNSPVLTKSIRVKTAIFFLTKGCFINNSTNALFYLWLYPSFREKAISLFRS